MLAIVVEEIPAILAPKDSLAVRRWQASGTTEQIELALRQRFDPASCVADRLNDECSVAAPASSAQRLSQLVGVGASLLHRSDDDTRTTRGHLLAGSVDDAAGQPGAGWHGLPIDVLRTEFGRPPDPNVPIRRQGELSLHWITRSSRYHERQAVRTKATQAIHDGRRQAMQQRPRRGGE
ncbi:MAG: hypothetical protein H0V49_04780 [Nocardioidaceae bacterium]|nr:hypothetical protein [Nocardioidaceae bacterium]